MSEKTVPENAVSQASDDLSAEIARIVPRTAREQVTCKRIDSEHYRCNWWMPQSLNSYDNPSMHGLMVTTNRVSRSSFLRVTRAANGELKIQERSVGGPQK